MGQLIIVLDAPGIFDASIGFDARRALPARIRQLPLQDLIGGFCAARYDKCRAFGFI
jgi:hypothetical protein